MLAKLPADTPVLAERALAEELVAAESAGHIIASQCCAEADVRDASRRRPARRWLKVFHTTANLTDVGLAAALGERVGWPAERVDALRDERDAGSCRVCRTAMLPRRAGAPGLLLRSTRPPAAWPR